MARYAAGRVAQFVPILLAATLLVHALVFLLPGDPVQSLAGQRPLTDEVRAALHARYGLDSPFLIRYLRWLGGALTGDLGETFGGRSVSSILASRFPVTMRLAIVAVAVEVMIGGVAGVVTALRRNRYLDNVVLVATTVLIAVPVFVLAYLGQLVLGVRLGWLPISGTAAGWRSYVLPGVVIGAVSLAYVVRLLRAGLTDALAQPYILTARAKGLPERRVVTRHALRNAAIPVVTFIGADLGALMAGAVVTEGIFNIPGIGGELFRALQAREAAVIVGIVTVLVAVFLVVNLLVDLATAWLDPRTTHE